MLKSLLILALLVSCSHFKKHKKKHPVITELAALEAKYAKYLEVSKEVTSDRQGWFDEKCDNLLFTSLVAHIPEIEVDISQAFDGERWHRRPNFMVECYPNYSKSTISRDMLLGVMWYAWNMQRVEIYKQMEFYGSRNDWNFGDGDRSRTVMTPQQMGTIYLAINKLVDENHLEANTPLELLKNDDGFRAHLGILHALLRAEMYGYAPGYYVDYFLYHAERQPENPLFQYAKALYTNGDMQPAIDILLKEDYWPNEGSVTSYHRCSPWVLERDFGDSWLPCDSGEVHSGYDFIFVANLILSYMNR